MDFELMLGANTRARMNFRHSTSRCATAGVVWRASEGKQNAVLKLCPLLHLFHVLLVLLNHPALRPHSIFQLTNSARLFVYLLPHYRPGTLYCTTNTRIHRGRAHFVLMQGPQAQTQQRQQAGAVPAQEQFIMSK